MTHLKIRDLEKVHEITAKEMKLVSGGRRKDPKSRLLVDRDGDVGGTLHFNLITSMSDYTAADQARSSNYKKYCSTNSNIIKIAG